MASMALTTTLSKLQSAGVIVRRPWSSRIFVGRTSQTSRHFGAMATYDEAAEAAKKGLNAAKRGSQEMKNDAAAAADEAVQKAKEMTGKVSNTAQNATGMAQQTTEDVGGKMKQTAQDAWGSVKDTTQKIKDTVVGKAEESKEVVGEKVKAQAAKVEESMNTKNIK